MGSPAPLGWIRGVFWMGSPAPIANHISNPDLGAILKRGSDVTMWSSWPAATCRSSALWHTLSVPAPPTIHGMGFKLLILDSRRVLHPAPEGVLPASDIAKHISNPDFGAIWKKA